MIIRKLRLQRGWSQEQLARISGLNIRTIQRIERGQNPSLESRKALAAVFEIDLSELQESEVNTEQDISDREKRVIEHVRDIKAFYSHVITYVLVIIGLFILNLITSPGYFWVLWAALGWGIGLISHGMSVFEVFSLFGPEWEKSKWKRGWGRNSSFH
ncbi:2TM domain-containing protein [Microbulbifer sp. MLAF003]|uniref:2TM domain-containing protein n=1 Tax=Microbulbifer sp. MLAF003 TaxID=3032582 RepID=UPI0024ACAD99|nr:2TM domain-containing protein [Microbulbifer sp. MLAF003]WHI49735.1 2TM domain-containing protein [Microbulbifer sp. MLAF003]